MYLLQIANELNLDNTKNTLSGFNLNFAIRLLIDLLTILVLVRGIHFRLYKRADLFLTLFSFNLIIFLLTFLLNKVEMTMGAAFGLFAVFSMLRYRTENISTKDMTYLFIVIAIGLIMAVSKGGWQQQALTGLLILLFTWLMESNWLIRREFTKKINYEKIELIHEEKRTELINDLKKRTGLNVMRVEVLDIDFLKDAAEIIVYYHK